MPTATQVRKMNDKPKVSDRLQYGIGALISIVLLSGYLVLSDDKQASSAVTEIKLEDVSAEIKDQTQVEQVEQVEAQH